VLILDAVAGVALPERADGRHQRVKVVMTHHLPLTGRSGGADSAGERAERRREPGSRWSAARRRLEREAFGPGFTEQSLPVSDTLSLDVV
jgi:hypothetical protein